MEEFDFVEGWKAKIAEMPPPESPWSPVEATDMLAGVPHPVTEFRQTQTFLDMLVETRGICPMLASSIYGEWYRSVADGSRVVEGSAVEDFVAHALMLGAEVDEHLKALEIKREAEVVADRLI